MNKRFLVASLATWFALSAGVAAGLRWYAARHYLPRQRMERAVAAGHGCFVTLGDSRMDAATDADALHAPLRVSGHDRCHALLAIGGTDISGAALIAREYLSHGLRPRAVIIGKVGDSILGGFESLPPEDMVGNNAIHLTWSQPRDVFAEVPGFPLANVGAFDAGLRFLAARATSLGRYQSLVSAKTQALEAELTGSPPVPGNRFGALGDMARLEDGLRARAPGRLAAAMAGPQSDRLGPWFGALVRLLQQHQIPFVVLELPMKQAYRDHVTDTPQARAYQQWLRQELPGWGGALLDLSHAEWVQDSLFADQLHLGAAGAHFVSAELGRYLAAAPLR